MTGTPAAAARFLSAGLNAAPSELPAIGSRSRTLVLRMTSLCDGLAGSTGVPAGPMTLHAANRIWILDVEREPVAPAVVAERIGRGDFHHGRPIGSVLLTIEHAQTAVTRSQCGHRHRSRFASKAATDLNDSSPAYQSADGHDQIGWVHWL
jgi:hypothetical protein